MCGTQGASAPNPYNEKAFKFKLKYVDLLMESAKAKTNTNSTTTLSYSAKDFLLDDWELGKLLRNITSH